MNVWGIQFNKIRLEHIPCIGHHCWGLASRGKNRIVHERDPSVYSEPDSLGRTLAVPFPSCVTLRELFHSQFLICKQGANCTFVVGLL